MKKKLLGSVLAVMVAIVFCAIFALMPNHMIQSNVYAQAGPTGSFVLFPSGSDPCQNPSIAKSFKVVNISTATTTELVAAVAGKAVYLCGLKATVAGTSPTILFVTGTKVSTACDTGAANQSGTYAITTGTLVELGLGGGVSLLTGASGGELCLTSGGTTPSIQGNLAYVQQ